MKTNYDKKLNDKTKKEIIVDYTKNLFSIREICKKYNIKSKSYLCKKLLKGLIRNCSEGNKIAHKRYPQSFLHSEETKEKIRKSRLRYLKEHPESTAWRRKNMSFPEKCFKKIIEENGIDKKFLIYQEYSVFPFYIDFAFIDIKVAVEIDGSQHLQEDRKKRDEIKDKVLAENGWRVIRFSASEVMYNTDNVLNKLLVFIKTDKTFEIVGLLKAQKSYIKKQRNENGYTEAQELSFIKQRKVKNRPSKEKLWEEVCSDSFSELGRKYGVSDKSITKWCKMYNLPYRKKDINKIIKEKK